MVLVLDEWEWIDLGEFERGYIVHLFRLRNWF